MFFRRKSEAEQAADEAIDIAKIHQKALDDSQKMLSRASEEAQNIIQKAVQLSSLAELDIEARLIEAAKVADDQTKRSLDQIFVQQSRIIKRMSDELTVAAKQQMERMRVELDAGLSRALEAATGELTKQAKQVQISLDEYTQQEQARIKATFIERVPGVLQDILGRAISLDEHEQLIDDALAHITKEVR